MNSASVRVECPIVSTLVEGFGLGFLFAPRPRLSVLILATLIFEIFRIADAQLLRFADND